MKVDGSELTADLSALSVSWNGQYFNQGAGRATGTIDTGSGRYRLDWTSPIKGGPFNGFTGVWHFEGSFKGS